MKKSELKQIIREEIQKTLVEEKINKAKDFLETWKENAVGFKNSIGNLKNAYYKKYGK